MQKNIILICGPRGVGKDTIVKEFISLYPDKYKRVASYCTRKMREGEIDGVDYHFIDRDSFLKKFEQGDIFEFTQYQDTFRGTGHSCFDSIISDGKVAVKSIDIIGINMLRKKYPEQVVSIFITADKDIIIERLRKSGTYDIEDRIKDYEVSLQFINEHDHVIVNNGPVQEAVEAICKILQK